MSKGMTMLEYITGERESRTGITRLNQGLDADALNKTATGTALMQAQGQQMEEYVARNFAEALARLFAKKLRLMMAVGKPISVKIDGQARLVDPAEWPSGLSANVRVGLGSGRKEQRLQYRAQMLDMQKEALPVGLASKRNIFRNLAAMVRDAGLGIPTDYFLDPASPEGQAAGNGPAQPHPDLVKAQAEAQAQAQRLMLERQKAEAELALGQQHGAAKIGALREEAAMKLQLERDRAAAEAALERERMAMEYSLAERRLQAGRPRGGRGRRTARPGPVPTGEDGIAAMRPGGALDE
jgi:hypothetical protein